MMKGLGDRVQVLGLGEPLHGGEDFLFSHGFGRLRGNRELVEWMRGHNADPACRAELHFYGFDSPTERTSADSPRELLTAALDYIGSVDAVTADEHRGRIISLLGDDDAWSNPEAASTRPPPPTHSASRPSS